MSYGWCPRCGGKAVQRARNPIGPTTCENGHSFPHRETLNAEPTAEILAVLNGAKPVPTPASADRKGALVYAVSTHAAADALTPLLTAFPDPHTDGVRVIPFGASALAYCGRDARLFRGLVVIRPRDAAVDVKAFERWVHAAIRPYLAPGAPTVTL